MRSKRASATSHYEIPSQYFAGNPNSRAWVPSVSADDEADVMVTPRPAAMSQSSRMQGASRYAAAGRATLSEPMC
ncbi:hypothetical protein [Schauerella aestuarii]|uniref:hypothetical protein n=1 Tax=Schauerella aestuarii TaxID=2511204 RepID=UPI00136CC5B1|nr:hypothetical protein [Achromobacter aestuarii]MYZ42981.1 hypothetical protein [Achromobacter aestuarii]